MTTIKDVAREAGLAVGTVSRVLNNRGYISEQTRQKVNEAMKKLDYHPNEVARILSQKKSSLIGVIVPHIYHPYFAEFVEELEIKAQEYNYKILLLTSKGLTAKENEYLEFCRRNHVAGIILFHGTLDADAFSHIGIPVISIERHMEHSAISIEKGCRSLLYLGGRIAEHKHVEDEREKGFVAVCEEKGIAYQIIDVPLDNYDLPDDFSKIKDTLMASDIDGIFASSDLLAARAIRDIYQAGKRVPEDVKVVGFDDISLAEMMSPSLTTIHQPLDLMATQAIEAINAFHEEKEISSMSVFPVTLIARESTQE